MTKYEFVPVRKAPIGTVLISRLHLRDGWDTRTASRTNGRPSRQNTDWRDRIEVIVRGMDHVDVLADDYRAVLADGQPLWQYQAGQLEAIRQAAIDAGLTI